VFVDLPKYNRMWGELEGLSSHDGFERSAVVICTKGTIANEKRDAFLSTSEIIEALSRRMFLIKYFDSDNCV
jgi:hypothetical protein